MSVSMQLLTIYYILICRFNRNEKYDNSKNRIDEID